MVLEIISEQDIIKITILLGALVDNFFATFIPYAIEKARFKDEYDLHMVFSPQFLGTAALAAITFFIAVNTMFSSIIAQVGAQSTLFSAFVSALTIGRVINYGANKFMSSQNIPQKSQAEIDRQRIIQDYKNLTSIHFSLYKSIKLISNQYQNLEKKKEENYIIINPDYSSQVNSVAIILLPDLLVSFSHSLKEKTRTLVMTMSYIIQYGIHIIP